MDRSQRIYFHRKFQIHSDDKETPKEPFKRILIIRSRRKKLPPLYSTQTLYEVIWNAGRLPSFRQGQSTGSPEGGRAVRSNYAATVCGARAFLKAASPAATREFAFVLSLVFNDGQRPPTKSTRSTKIPL